LAISRPPSLGAPKNAHRTPIPHQELIEMNCTTAPQHGLTAAAARPCSALGRGWNRSVGMTVGSVVEFAATGLDTGARKDITTKYTARHLGSLLT
jgi:hypothetical protein